MASPLMQKRRSRRAGFSLIELIGVMAIIAILAAIVAPMTVSTIDRVATRAEVVTLRRLGELTRLHLQRTGALPTNSSWRSDLVAYTDLSYNNLQYNPRQMARAFFTEPVSGGAPSTRVLILSSMRSGLALPTSVSATQFSEIWDTTDGQRPATWTSWPAEFADLLVIERVNLATEFQSYVCRLQNTSAAAVSYVITRPGAPAIAQPVPVGFTDVSLRSGWRLDLHRNAAGSNLGYSFIVANHARSFVFDGTTWTAP